MNEKGYLFKNTGDIKELKKKLRTNLYHLAN